MFSRFNRGLFKWMVRGLRALKAAQPQLAVLLTGEVREFLLVCQLVVATTPAHGATAQKFLVLPFILALQRRGPRVQRQGQ
jgi:hypothetical protein